jgi:hypothetical protein
MNYKFENHKAELTDPKIEEVKSSFSIGSDFVQVSAILSANGAKLYWVDLGQMPNTESWGDEELQAFALNALEKFKV